LALYVPLTLHKYSECREDSQSRGACRCLRCRGGTQHLFRRGGHISDPVPTPDLFEPKALQTPQNSRTGSRQTYIDKHVDENGGSTPHSHALHPGQAMGASLAVLHIKKWCGPPLHNRRRQQLGIVRRLRQPKIISPWSMLLPRQLLPLATPRSEHRLAATHMLQCLGHGRSPLSGPRPSRGNTGTPTLQRSSLQSGTRTGM